MTTRIRIDPIEGWHHVTNHRVGNGDLFLTDADRWLFLRLLAAAAAKFKVEVVTYCLMGNHFHLVVHCPDARLSLFMHHVGGVYARAFNTKHGRRGPLFVDNFYNEIITTDGQLIFTTRYVDRNPLELNIDIRTYPWSSYRFFVGTDALSTSTVPLHPSVPLQLVGGATAYRRFVETDEDRDKHPMRNGVRTVVGSPPVEIAAVLAELNDAALRRTNRLDLTDAGRRRVARSVAVHIAHENSVGFGKELRDFFGFGSAASYTSFLYRNRTRYEIDSAFRSLVDAVQQEWSAIDLPVAS